MGTKLAFKMSWAPLSQKTTPLWPVKTVVVFTSMFEAILLGQRKGIIDRKKGIIVVYLIYRWGFVGLCLFQAMRELFRVPEQARLRFSPFQRFGSKQGREIESVVAFVSRDPSFRTLDLQIGKKALARKTNPLKTIGEAVSPNKFFCETKRTWMRPGSPFIRLTEMTCSMRHCLDFVRHKDLRQRHRQEIRQCIHNALHDLNQEEVACACCDEWVPKHDVTRAVHDDRVGLLMKELLVCNALSKTSDQDTDGDRDMKDATDRTGDPRKLIAEHIQCADTILTLYSSICD
jgi:hypothetical protein